MLSDKSSYEEKRIRRKSSASIVLHFIVLMGNVM